MDCYEYVHHPGYGRDDHMADEIIARAARRLGLAGAGGHIAACVGLASHPIPMSAATVRLRVERGTKQRMLSALRHAEGEVLRRDCWIAVARVRYHTERLDGGAMRRVREEKRGQVWVETESWYGEGH